MPCYLLGVVINSFFPTLVKSWCVLLCNFLSIVRICWSVTQMWDFFYRYPYLAVVLNFSQTWALYCLVQFYSVIKDKLAPIKPLAKFLTFKSIVFLTWWQGVAVAFLFSMGAFKGALAQELKTRIQDYIICIEVWLIMHLLPIIDNREIIHVFTVDVFIIYLLVKLININLIGKWH